MTGSPLLRGGRGERGDVPAAPLREAFVASHLTYSAVARRLDWRDGTRVARTLGLRPQAKPGRVPLEQKRVSYENAVALADALGVDYTEIGV